MINFINKIIIFTPFLLRKELINLKEQLIICIDNKNFIGYHITIMREVIRQLLSDVKRLDDCTIKPFSYITLAEEIKTFVQKVFFWLRRAFFLFYSSFTLIRRFCSGWLIFPLSRRSFRHINPQLVKLKH